MNYIDKTLDKINGILLSSGCGLYPGNLKEIGFILATATMVGAIDSKVSEDALNWLTTNMGNDETEN